MRGALFDGIMCVDATIRWGKRGKEALHDAPVHGPPQERGRVDRRSGGRGSRKGPRSPTKAWGELHKVLVQRGEGRGLLPGRGPKRASSGRCPQGSPRPRGRRDNRGEGRFVGCSGVLFRTKAGAAISPGP